MRSFNCFPCLEGFPAKVFKYFFIVPGSLEKFCLQNRTACLCVLSSVIIFCRQCGSQDDVAYSRIGRTTVA